MSAPIATPVAAFAGTELVTVGGYVSDAITPAGNMLNNIKTISREETDFLCYAYSNN